jgi:hypothetical protein
MQPIRSLILSETTHRKLFFLLLGDRTGIFLSYLWKSIPLPSITQIPLCFRSRTSLRGRFLRLLALTGPSITFPHYRKYRISWS